MAFDLKRLLMEVFETQAGETVLVACDRPYGALPDNEAWKERRKMAVEWRTAFEEMQDALRFTTQPLLEYPATGIHGAELPIIGMLGGEPVDIATVLLRSTLAVFLTEFSATAALDVFCRQKEDFRAASLPGLERRMENMALTAEYREIAWRCRLLQDAMQGAESMQVKFSSGESCLFDLRFRRPEVDDGYLPRFKTGDRIINLPSGETFMVPYEGERPGECSRTAGCLPVALEGETAVCVVAQNRITDVQGCGPGAARLRRIFDEDPARRNIAEVAFGCNDRAIVTGNVLEDEKAGFHWAYGRSDHLGGTVGVDAFLRPDTVVHHDIVYAQGSPIQVAEAIVAGPRGDVVVIRNGEYVIF
jgi:hypothetical protein